MKTHPLTAKNLHHAMLYVGDRNAGLREVTAFISDVVRISLDGNPDFSVQEFETFGILDARALRERQEMRGFGGGKKVFVIAFHFMMREAQNALLKVLEEPTPDTYFFLITPSSTPLLKTLRSRLQTMHRGASAQEARPTTGDTFLAASTTKRLKMIESFKDADNESKKSEFLIFLDDLERALARTLNRTQASQTEALLRELLTLKKYTFDRSPSLKMMAEYLAIRIPRASATTRGV